MSKLNEGCEVCGIGKAIKSPTKRFCLECNLCGASYDLRGKLDKKNMPTEFSIEWARKHPELA